eukprot:438603-Rhodomonas_salina.2
MRLFGASTVPEIRPTTVAKGQTGSTKRLLLRPVIVSSLHLRITNSITNSRVDYDAGTGPAAGLGETEGHGLDPSMVVQQNFGWRTLGGAPPFSPQRP